MEFSVPMVVGLVAAVISSISIILSLNLARRNRSAERTAAPGDELIAAMTAAVATAMGRPASGVRFVSIETRGGFTTPVWGHAERPARGQDSSIRE
jgi:hypothetical protein